MLRRLHSANKILSPSPICWCGPRVCSGPEASCHSHFPVIPCSNIEFQSALNP